MEPHEPFLQSILNSPDEIDEFLVYADWLLEQGDPRGDFIVSQIATKDPRTPMWQQTNHQKLADKIQLENWRNWVGEMATFLDRSLFLFKFERGFLSSLQLPYLSEEFAATLKSSPHCRFLRKLILLSTPNVDPQGNDQSPDLVTGLQLLREADFSNLRTLEFSYNNGDPRARDGRPSFEIIHSMKRLTSLTIYGSITPSHYDFLFSKEMPNLVELHIEDPIGNGPINSLCQSSWMEQLVLLKLQCGLDDRIAQKIADTLNPNVMDRIDIEENEFSEEAINTIEKTGVTIAHIA